MKLTDILRSHRALAFGTLLYALSHDTCSIYDIDFLNNVDAIANLTAYANHYLSQIPGISDFAQNVAREHPTVSETVNLISLPMLAYGIPGTTLNLAKKAAKRVFRRKKSTP